MSDYNWCHGPECHTKQTQSRIRGSGRDKVLRTIKIKIDPRYNNSIHSYFCNTRCLYDYLNEHAQAVANIAPRSKALETPVKVEVKTYDAPDHPYYNGRKYKTITPIDNSNG